MVSNQLFLCFRIGLPVGIITTKVQDFWWIMIHILIRIDSWLTAQIKIVVHLRVTSGNQTHVDIIHPVLRIALSRMSNLECLSSVTSVVEFEGAEVICWSFSPIMWWLSFVDMALAKFDMSLSMKCYCHQGYIPSTLRTDLNFWHAQYAASKYWIKVEFMSFLSLFNILNWKFRIKV